MTAILFAPHNDDETLFAFYSMLRHEPHVVVVLRSYRQMREQNGPTYIERELETHAVVCDLLGLTYEQWEYPDNAPDWPGIAAHIELQLGAMNADTVIGPARELGGHEDHNAVAHILSCLDVPLVRYLTYKRGCGRSTEGKEIVPTAEERALKARALACYTSQAAHPPTAPWFRDDQREFVA